METREEKFLSRFIKGMSNEESNEFYKGFGGKRVLLSILRGMLDSNKTNLTHKEKETTLILSGMGFDADAISLCLKIPPDVVDEYLKIFKKT